MRIIHFHGEHFGNMDWELPAVVEKAIDRLPRKSQQESMQKLIETQTMACTIVLGALAMMETDKLPEANAILSNALRQAMMNIQALQRKK